MKRFAYTLFCMAAFATSALAQANSDTLRVVESNVSRVGEDVIVDMKLDLSHIEVGRNRTLVYRPLLMKEDSVAELTPIIVNGRVRHIQYQRLERAEDFPNEIEIRRENGTEQTLDYHARVPFTDWMNKSEVVMVCDLCGCGWESLQNDRSSLFPVNLVHEPVVPAVLYITPLAEVKVREKSGSAYLDFPVNQTVIRPDYRRNSTELAAIDATIQSVEDDPNATIPSSPKAVETQTNFMTYFTGKEAFDVTDALETPVPKIINYNGDDEVTFVGKGGDKPKAIQWDGDRIKLQGSSTIDEDTKLPTANYISFMITKPGTIKHYIRSGSSKSEENPRYISVDLLINNETVKKVYYEAAPIDGYKAGSEISIPVAKEDLLGAKSAVTVYISVPTNSCNVYYLEYIPD